MEGMVVGGSKLASEAPFGRLSFQEKRYCRLRMTTNNEKKRAKQGEKTRNNKQP